MLLQTGPSNNPASLVSPSSALGPQNASRHRKSLPKLKAYQRKADTVKIKRGLCGRQRKPQSWNSAFRDDESSSQNWTRPAAQHLHASSLPRSLLAQTLSTQSFGSHFGRPLAAWHFSGFRKSFFNAAYSYRVLGRERRLNIADPGFGRWYHSSGCGCHQ